MASPKIGEATVRGFLIFWHAWADNQWVEEVASEEVEASGETSGVCMAVVTVVICGGGTRAGVDTVQEGEAGGVVVDIRAPALLLAWVLYKK